MKNYELLEPDAFGLMKKHFTPGRGGRRVKFVVLHHMAGIGDYLQCLRWWDTRAASAHYCISPTGHTGQTVYDRDTAWANADAVANAESITIEHSNTVGAAGDWLISAETLEEGAHLVAAICAYFRLGRPQWGVNVRTHDEFFATSCPYHLRRGGIYGANYMRRAQWWYDVMTGTIKDEVKEPPMSDAINLGSVVQATDGTEHKVVDLLRYTDGRVFVMESRTLPRLEEKMDLILEALGKLKIVPDPAGDPDQLALQLDCHPHTE